MTSRGARGGSDEEEEEEVDEIDAGDRSAATPTLVLRALAPERSSDRAARSSIAASERGLRVIAIVRWIGMPSGGNKAGERPKAREREGLSFQWNSRAE